MPPGSAKASLDQSCTTHPAIWHVLYVLEDVISSGLAFTAIAFFYAWRATDG